MNYISISFSVTNEEQKQILIAWLSDFGFEGFEETADGLKAFIPQEIYNEGQLVQLLNNISGNISFHAEIIEPKNWNEEWEKNFPPVIINDEVIIRASFHAPAKYPYEIIIDPKMSFGTGHHETTAMMIQLMLDNREDFPGKAVLDFGSGTGILSVLASKLGAGTILSIDNEEWAYHNAFENFSSNKISNAKALLGSANDFAGQAFDIILANINYNILTKHIVEISAALKPNGKLYCSGFLLNDEQGMMEEAAKAGLSAEAIAKAGNWLAITFQKKID